MNPLRGADAAQGLVVTRLAGVVYGDDGLRMWRRPRRHLGDIEQQRLRVDIGEDRGAPLEYYTVGGGREGERWDHDLVARPHIQRVHRRMQCRGPAADRYRLPHTDEARKGPLELGHLRSRG